MKTVADKRFESFAEAVEKFELLRHWLGHQALALFDQGARQTAGYATGEHCEAAIEDAKLNPKDNLSSYATALKLSYETWVEHDDGPPPCKPKMCGDFVEHTTCTNNTRMRLYADGRITVERSASARPIGQAWRPGVAKALSVEFDGEAWERQDDEWFEEKFGRSKQDVAGDPPPAPSA